MDRNLTMKLKLKPEPQSFDLVRQEMRKLTREQNDAFAGARAKLNLAGMSSYTLPRAKMELAREQADHALRSAIGRDKLGLSMRQQYGETLGPAMAKLAGLAGPLAVLTGGMWAAHAAITKFAGAARPDLLEKHNKAWDDLTAVVGRNLIPALEGMTSGVRAAGDIAATLSPGNNGLTKGIAWLGNEIGGINAMGRGLDEMRRRGWLADSTGAAPRPAEYMGIADLGRSNMLSAFSAGSDPASQTAQNTGDTRTMVEQLVNLVQGWVGNRGNERGVGG